MLVSGRDVAGSRERHYDADDVERFRAGRGARGAALTPVIGSAICLIENHRLYYRGRDAVQLAATASLEETAAILWAEAPHPDPRPASRERERVRIPHPRPAR